MNHDGENKQCQICSGYLFEEDEVVVCPICGAPHHKDCWQTVGHCGLEADHGTDRQYDKLKSTQAEESNGDDEARRCNSCGRVSNSHEGDFCPYCGQPYNANHRANHSSPFGAGHQGFPGGMPFDAYGGIPKDAMIEDVKVADAAKFVGSNSQRYIPRFAMLNKHNKGSWNWAAFLFPAVWNFSRKMYSNGIMYLILMVASSLCLVPFSMTLGTLDTDGLTRKQVVDLIMSEIDKFSWTTLIMMLVGVALYFIPRIICGRMADWTYRNFTLDKVRKITSNPEIVDTDEALMKAGNISILFMAIAFLLENNLPSIIVSLIW